MSKTIIVTGGCGYIGSHVARAFKMNGDRVFIIDRVKREHTLKDIDGYFIDDFASDESLATIIDLQPDIIVHCAGTSLVGPSMTDPAEYYNNNVSKTIAMLNVLKGMDKKPDIMFSSSASVYGIPATLPVHESMYKSPISPYGNTKYITELMLNDYCAAYGFDSICFRYFNAAGAEPINHDLGQEPGASHMVARVLEASLSNSQFFINGNDYNTPDGTCVRDYVHVWDIASAHVKASMFIDEIADSNGRTAVALVFNLGTNTGVSNQQIVDLVKGRYGLPAVEYAPRRAGDPDELVADATAAMQTLNWTPMFSDIDTIIDSAYKWYSQK